MPHPDLAQISTTDYQAVPFAPRPPPIEFIPAKPVRNAVWVDGTWEWVRDHYTWRFGTWVVPPAGVKWARWVVVRDDGGQLWFAQSCWKDKAGKTLEDTNFSRALGLRARARTRPGASAPTFEEPIVTRSPSEDEEQ